MAFLYILPFWIVDHVPTVDGPSHTYNAWILRQHGNTEDFPLFQRYYEINAKPYPNWLGHGVTALLMFVVPPIAAEKILLSGYVLLLLFGIRYLARSVRPDHDWLSFLAFAFPYNLTSQFGFYNFSLSVALLPWILGLWWRHRASPTLGFAVKINLLLWLCWLSHIVSFALSLLSIGVLWLATIRRETWRRHLRHVLILLPQAILPIWYFSAQGAATRASRWPFEMALGYFLNMGVLLSFSPDQLWFARTVAVLFAVLVLLTLWRGLYRDRRPREEDAFLLLGLFLIVVYFLSPNSVGGGTMLKIRLSLFPWLLLIPWLSPRLGRTAQAAGLAVLVLLAALNLSYQIRWYHRLDGEMGRFLAGLEGIPPNSRFVPLLFEYNGPSSQFPIFTHAANYVALEKGLVNWDNYEAAVDFFPTRFRTATPPPPVRRTGADPEALVASWEGRVDYVYTWRMPPGDPLVPSLGRRFAPVSEKEGGVLWEARSRVQP